MTEPTISKLHRRPFLIFWGLFILLHLLLFFQNDISLLDQLGLLQGPTIDAGSWTGRIHMLFVKNKYHFLVISGELLLFFSVLFFIKAPGKWWNRILYISFIFFFVYNIYFEFNHKFYGIIPSFRNDYVLLQEVLPIFLNSLTGGSATLSYVFAIVFVILAGLFFIWLLKHLLKNFVAIRSYKLTKAIFAVLWIFTLIYSFDISYKFRHQKALAIHWMSPNVLKSMQLEDADKYATIESNEFEPYLSQKLTQKPNIYLLFIESYGTVATESAALKPSYLKQIKNLESRIKKLDYHIASTYSISPVKGGRSWLAFSSFMSGLKVDNQIQYNDLIQRNFEYPNMVRYFNQQGYQTYRLSTMSNVDSDSLIPYARTNRYWGFDEWWTYEDFEYKGFLYDMLGGIPDQYALEYFRAKIAPDKQQPKLLFYITMASHMPWFKPPPLLDDWRVFNTMKSDQLIDIAGTDLERYKKAIAYELELMTRFIEAEQAPSLFILVGDHQPPGMEYLIADQTDDSATPLHIISKDSVFVNHFLDQGFQEGLEVDLKRLKYIRHEDFYKVLLDGMVRDSSD